MSNVDVTFIAECQKVALARCIGVWTVHWTAVLNRTFVPISLVSDKMTILSIVKIFFSSRPNDHRPFLRDNLIGIQDLGANEQHFL